jgi:hypothetical protein
MKLNENQISLIKNVAFNFERIMNQHKADFKKHNENALTFYDPKPIYVPVFLKFIPGGSCAKTVSEITDAIFKEDMPREISYHLDSSKNYKALQDLICDTIMFNSIEGIHRCFAVNSAFSNVAGFVSELSPLKEKDPLYISFNNINEKIYNRLTRELVIYKLNFLTKKDHWQFNNTMNILNDLVQRKEKTLIALHLMNHLVEEELVEETGWLTQFQRFFTDFMTAYTIDPSEETKIYFAYQTIFNAGNLCRYTDVPFVKNRVYGSIFDIALMIAEDSNIDDTDIQQLVSRASEFITERKLKKQKYKN